MSEEKSQVNQMEIILSIHESALNYDCINKYSCRTLSLIKT